MEPCKCGKPGCITCLTESTLPTRDTKGPDMPEEAIDGVILVVRRPAHRDEMTDLKMQESSVMLQSISNLLNFSGLISSVSLRKTRDTK